MSPGGIFSRKSPMMMQPVKVDAFIKTSVGVRDESHPIHLSQLMANGVLPLREHYLNVYL